MSLPLYLGGTIITFPYIAEAIMNRYGKDKKPWRYGIQITSHVLWPISTPLVYFDKLDHILNQVDEQIEKKF